MLATKPRPFKPFIQLCGKCHKTPIYARISFLMWLKHLLHFKRLGVFTCAYCLTGKGYGEDFQ